MKNRFISDKLAAIAIVVALSFSDTVAVAQTSTPIKNVVIVHGAFVDASGFDAVYQILKKDGYKVTLVQNPLTSLEDDVKAIYGSGKSK